MFDYIKSNFPYIISSIALFISAWGFIISRRNAKRIEYQENTYKEIYQKIVLEKASDIYFALNSIQVDMYSEELSKISLKHGIEIKEWPYFTKKQRIIIDEAWSLLNRYLSLYWLDKDGKIKTIKTLSYEDIGKISFDHHNISNELLGTVMYKFEEIIKSLRK